MKIEEIVEAILHNRIRITDHADEEAVNDHLKFEEIFYSVIKGEIIEIILQTSHYQVVSSLVSPQQGNQFTVFGHIIKRPNGQF